MSSPSAVLSSTSSAAAMADVSARIPTKTLKQEDFLKILVAQLTTQDPMNPKADMDFVTQMAQFSSLEQSQAIAKEIGAMRADSNVSQASALLGRTVVLQHSSDSFVKGQVASVVLEKGVPKLVVNTQLYSLDQVVSIMPAADPIK